MHFGENVINRISQAKCFAGLFVNFCHSSLFIFLYAKRNMCSDLNKRHQNKFILISCWSSTFYIFVFLDFKYYKKKTAEKKFILYSKFEFDLKVVRQSSGSTRCQLHQSLSYFTTRRGVSYYAQFTRCSTDLIPSYSRR